LPERMEGRRLLCVKLEPGVGVEVREAPTAMAGCGPDDVADPDWDADDVCPSAGRRERWRPRCMWRSQYFWSGTTSRAHRHFFPSVRRHRPGSGSVLFATPK
jgi:hypothetical protein